MQINKKDVIQLLERIALLLELKGENAFRIAAYRRAAQGLERDERSLYEIDDLTSIKGIGQGTNAVIQEYMTEGTSTLLTELENEVPKGLIDLLSISGLGGKRIATLYQELGITDLQTLRERCESGDVEKLPGFGAKTVANILTSLEEINVHPERIPLAMTLPLIEAIEQYLRTIHEIERFSLAGSVRRTQETVKDIDFIVATYKPQVVREKILMIEHKQIVASGETKISLIVKSEYDIHIDFRLVQPEQYATTLHHFTGSKEHNVRMRQLAKSRGEKINEYGVINEQTEEIKTFQTETEFFNHFGLYFIPPSLREGNYEIEAFQHEISLIKHEHVRGDLHMHTTWSDGAHSIEEMVQFAREKGYEYIAITDHSKFLQVANGLNENRLLRQREEILRLNEIYDDIHIFSGVEMDILPDGRLDFSDDFLKKMDFVIAAIHSGFNQTEKQIMKRLYRALENPYISMIAHPTGRLIGERDGYHVNMEKLLQKAKETDTALEINANPRRFDLSAKWAKRAQEMGINLAINSDAHSERSFDLMHYGIQVAQKGWIKQETVLNTWPVDDLIEYFSRHK